MSNPSPPTAKLFCNLAISILTEAIYYQTFLLTTESVDIRQWRSSMNPSILAKRHVVLGNRSLLQLNLPRKVNPAKRAAVMRKRYALKGNTCVEMDPAKTSAVPRTSPPQQNSLVRASPVRTAAATAIPRLEMGMHAGLKINFWNKHQKIRLAVLGNHHLAVISPA